VAEERFAELVAEARTNNDVLGLYVFGSRAFDDELRDEHSDYDVGVVLRDGAVKGFDARWPYRHGAQVEVVRHTLDELRAHAEHGTPTAWARPLYLRVDLIVDKTGQLAPILEAKRFLPDADRRGIVEEALGAYVNSTYRSLRYGTRLDAVESASPLITLVFALEGRVRPFNKHLTRELRERPFANAAFGGLDERVLRVLDGDRAEQHALFRDVERAARADGLGEQLDGWEPDLAWLRGDAGYRDSEYGPR
jgi:predicted nucleotidyltransferase